jgi:hypothetical protein
MDKMEGMMVVGDGGVVVDSGVDDKLMLPLPKKRTDVGCC